MTRRTFAVGIGLTIALACVAGCKDEIRTKPRIIATTGMIADLARQIGGTHVDVEALMGPGIDPHLFTPSFRDTDRLQNADLILYNGLHLEGKMSDLFEEMQKEQGRRVLAVAARIDPKRLRFGAGNAHAIPDPHIWFDVALWLETIDPVRDALCEIDPTHASDYHANAELYRQTLHDLDAEVKAKVQTIPPSQRVLFTSHDAFGYFGRAYGFEVYGLQGVSTDAEISTQDVIKIADLIGNKPISTVFAETIAPERGLKRVLEVTAEKYHKSVRLATDRLYADALGEPGSPAETYVGMIRHNVDALVRNLK